MRSAFDNGRAAVTSGAGAAEAAPARPEDDREHESYGTDHHQDDPDGVDAETRRGRVDRPNHDRTGGDHQKTDCCTHQGSLEIVVSRTAEETRPAGAARRNSSPSRLRAATQPLTPRWASRGSNGLIIRPRVRYTSARESADRL